jgi:Protein of unknown function (DUF993)
VTAAILLPGRAEPLRIPDPAWPGSHPVPRSRHVFAAAHVAAFPDGSIDWQPTLGFRDHLWAHGFAVAEAMDTAQRGTGLSWAQAKDLITRAAERAARRGGMISCGVGTDQLPDGGPHSRTAIVRAYEEQLDLVQAAGPG